MKLKLPGPLVTAEWVSENRSHPNLLILDATLKPVQGRPVEYALEIPGSRTFDIEKMSDPESDLPHMMPSPDYFTQEIQKLGVNNDSLIVVYDQIGVYSSPRARLMLMAMGHANVAVLNGGLPHWKKLNFPVDQKKDPQNFFKGDFVAKNIPGYFCGKSEISKAITAKGVIVDARSQGRFMGLDPEPRPGLKSGRIPLSLNLPFGAVLDGHLLRGKSEITTIFKNIGVSTESKIFFSCGSGVTACILALAAEISGHTNVIVYDGSWADWGRDA